MKSGNFICDIGTQSFFNLSCIQTYFPTLQVAEVKEYMRFRKVPPSTQNRVMDFYDRMYQKKYFDEKSILFEPNMSPILRNVSIALAVILLQ